MNKMKNIFLFFGLLSCFCVVPIHALVVGSNSAVSKEGFAAFPAVDIDNEILAFAYMSAGFSLEDNTTTMTFSSLFPISGPVDLNGGTMTLNTNVIFNEDATLTGLGTIVGTGNQAFRLAESMTALPATATSFSQVNLILNSNVTINSAITIAGDTAIEGRGYKLNLGVGGSISIANGVTLTVSNTMIDGVTSSNVIFGDNASTLVLDSASVRFTDDYSMTQGILQINGNSTLRGPVVFEYSSTNPIEINAFSALQLAGSLELKFSSPAPLQAISFVDQTSKLYFDDGTLHVGTQGLQLIKGLVRILSNGYFVMDSLTPTQGLILGDGTGANDIVFDIQAASAVSIQQGAFVYKLSTPNGIVSKSLASQLELLSAAKLVLATSLTFSNMTIYRQTGATIVGSPGLEFILDNVTLLTDTSEFQGSATFTNPTAVSLTGNNTIKINNGYIILGVNVSNTNNIIEGNGRIDGDITLADVNAGLTLQLLGELNASLVLNSGTVTLGSDLNFRGSSFVVGPGIMNTGTFNVSSGLSSINASTAVTWTGTASTIDCNADVVLTDVWTFSGTTYVLDLNGFSLNFDNVSAAIVVDSGTTLTIRNGNINGINGTNISCADDTATIIFDNTVLDLSDDVTFADGTLQFKNNVIMKGGKTLFYESTQNCILSEQAKLALIYGTIFDYNPSDSNPSLLVLNSGSELILNNSRINVGLMGINMLGGALVVQGSQSAVYVATDAFNDNGITFGDNTTALNDCAMKFINDATLTILNGSMNYKNMDTASFYMSGTESILSMAANTILNVYQAFSFGPGQFLLGDGAVENWLVP